MSEGSLSDTVFGPPKVLKIAAPESPEAVFFKMLTKEHIIKRKVMSEAPIQAEWLVPTPRHVDPLDESWGLSQELKVDAGDFDVFAPTGGADPWSRSWPPGLGAELERLGVLGAVGAGDSADLKIRRLPTLSPMLADPSDEAYELRIDRTGIRIGAKEAVGVFRALTTLAQWLRLHPSDSHAKSRIHGTEIRDAPDFAHRGWLLDISRNRVPTASELRAAVDLAAELKLNQIQLYTEHTFAYVGHEKVWQGWSPLTAEEVQDLADYAERRFVEWVPNQNAFGHLHRWLVHEPYRSLAESPGGINHPFSPHREPFSLCPTDPGSLDLLRDLFGQLLPLASSSLFNANLDETLDLGQGRSRELCETLGTERVYLDFVRQVHGLAAQHGKRMMMWGDIILKRPELIGELPEDVVMLEWGYEAGHPFDKDCARFADAGREFYVCPGTGGWSTFGGRVENTWANLVSAAVEGHRHGASGYLITDWGDHGHLQPPPVSYPGLTAGAALSWNVSSAGMSSAGMSSAEPGAGSQEDFCWAEKLSLHVLGDRSPLGRGFEDHGSEGRGSENHGSEDLGSEDHAGAVLLDLGRIHDFTGVQALNGGSLFYALMYADKKVEERRDLGMAPESLAAAMSKLDEVVARSSRWSAEIPDGDLLRDEIRWVADALRLGVDVARRRQSVGEEEPLSALTDRDRQALGRALNELSESLKPIWLRRSRQGGLAQSIERLNWIRSCW